VTLFEVITPIPPTNVIFLMATFQFQLEQGVYLVCIGGRTTTAGVRLALVDGLGTPFLGCQIILEVNQLVSGQFEISVGAGTLISLRTIGQPAVTFDSIAGSIAAFMTVVQIA
jgi:hypothetical protein